MTRSMTGDYIPGLCQRPETTKPMQRIEEIYGTLELEAVLAIEKIIKLEQEFPGIVQVRLLDHIDILADSARKGKYPLNNWLEPNGRGTSKISNYKSIGHHILEQLRSPNARDKDSGRPPRLHAAIRLMMEHTRDSKGIVNPEDSTGSVSDEVVEDMAQYLDRLDREDYDNGKT